MAPEKQIRRKILPLLGNIGSVGGLTFAIYYEIFPETVYYWLGFCFLMMMIGTIAGVMIVDFYDNKGEGIVVSDVDRVRLFLQPAYIYAVIPFVLLFVLGMIVSRGFVEAFIGFALMPTIYFILGIGNGLFDYTQTANRKILYTALIPLIIAIFKAFVSGPYGFYKDPVWIFGSLYMLFFMLTINRIKIEELFVLSRKVNVENKKTIRRRNDFLIMIFFALYLIIFVVRNTFTRISEWIFKRTVAVIGFIINFFYKMRKVLEVEQVQEVVEEGIPDEVPPIPPTMNPTSKTILIVIASLTIALVLYFLVKKIIQLIRWLIGKAGDTLAGGKRIKRDTENEEFEEIVEFTKDKARRKRQKTIRYRYSLRELRNLDTYKEKVRYLYGFALERLKYKNVKISKADTPEEIVDKLGTYENGNKLVDNVFKDFTDEYINVRYGNKETGQDENFMEKADVVDKGIENIKVKDEKTVIQATARY